MALSEAKMAQAYTNRKRSLLLLSDAEGLLCRRGPGPGPAVSTSGPSVGSRAAYLFPLPLAAAIASLRAAGDAVTTLLSPRNGV
jgi:hypothetical protein